MKKIFLLIALTSLSSVYTTIHAQTNNDEKITVKDKNGNDEDIDIPEAMTLEVDSLLHLYNTKMYLRPDTGCNYENVNPKYDKSVYVERLRSMPTLIEMPYNDVVRKFIDRYSGRLRRSVSIMLGTSNLYMPIFEQALETYGLPLELKYLPVIESGLNPKAVSRVGATGLWQFMLTTGKQYGLEVNSLVDERCDIVKSSYAAAHYLSDLYKIFGDWNLVIAAYNCGPGKINQAIHRTNGSRDYWEIYPYLPRETRGYVPAFIAANYIMNYYCEHNICPMVTDLPAKTDTLTITKDVHFEQISHVLGIDIEQLKELNPQYRRNIVNGLTKPSTLRLPSSYVIKYIDNEKEINNYNAEQLLSKRVEVAVKDEAPAYKADHRTYTRGKSSTRDRRSRASKTSRKRRGGGSKEVSIRQGDTLSEIAARNNTTVAKLKKLNKISGTNIRAGKKIKVK